MLAAGGGNLWCELGTSELWAARVHRGFIYFLRIYYENQNVVDMRTRFEATLGPGAVSIDENGFRQWQWSGNGRVAVVGQYSRGVRMDSYAPALAPSGPDHPQSP